MPLPPLTEDGELPVGVHLGSSREVLDRFGVGSDQRKALALRLARVRRVAEATRRLARFVIFGSPVTGKSEPNDVDILLIMVPRKRTSAPACSGSGDWQRGRMRRPR